ncbi:NADPH oxidase 4 isoform X5 [Takifugu rubripes]|uniref:NADPH oxidase 4 isoform X5 n=1 Tax=Takifugu rubripes TaxID=31033 RepID=UPI001145A882|nr:NADPH oxidase 4 isoform X5 [Takifugu rubripes]
MSVRSWIANEGGKFLVLMLWLGVNTWMFLNTFLLFSSGEQYYYLYKMLGLGLCISRASASVLNLNCSLVLLPMCRSLLKFIRGTHTVSSRKTRRMLDKYKTFHVACGLAICIFSAIHVSAHLANAANFSTSYSEEFPSLNVARYRGEDPKWIILTTIPGVTGIVLVLILFLMLMSSSNCVRSFNYEIFWYTHNLFIVFYIVLMVHMVGGVLKYQTNIEAHPPGCFTANQSNMDPQAKEMEKADNEERRCTEEAHFQGHYPQTWIWLSGPLCLYCAERFFRYIRSCDPVTIVTVIRHPCNVIELQMLKNKFAARPGQYILLNCPAVSSFENHPFTLTTCPTENKKTFSIHLRIVGDWTERFTQLLLTGSRTDMKTLPMVQHRKYPKICLRSTDHLLPGYWSVGRGGSCCSMNLERPTNISELVFSAVDQKPSPGPSTGFMWLQVEQLSFVGSGFKSLPVLQCSGIWWDQGSISDIVVRFLDGIRGQADLRRALSLQRTCSWLRPNQRLLKLSPLSLRCRIVAFVRAFSSSSPRSPVLRLIVL